MKSKNEIMKKFDEMRKDIAGWLDEKEEEEIYYKQGDVIEFSQSCCRYMLALYNVGEMDDDVDSNLFSLVNVSSKDYAFRGRIWVGAGESQNVHATTNHKISHTDLSNFIGKDYSFKKVD